MSIIKSDLMRRIAGGFVAGAIAILAVQPPEGLAEAVQALLA